MKTIKIDDLESVYKAVLNIVTQLATGVSPNKNYLGEIFSPSFFAIGPGNDDKNMNYRECLEMLQRKELSGKKINVNCIPLFRSYSSDEQSAIFVEELQYLSVRDDSSQIAPLRLSTFLFKLPEGWRVTHLHASLPAELPQTKITYTPEIKEQLNGTLDENSKKLREALEELEANRAQLIKQEKLASLGQLTAGIAHEIKNPLNFINNFSELSSEFLEEIDENLRKLEANDITEEIRALLDEVKGNLAKIHQHGSRADGIVKSMLLHSRGGSGKMEETDLNALIREYVNLSFHGMRANKNPINVDIKLEMDEDLGPVKINSENFSRVILNLCKNAFDAMREKLEMENDGKYLPQLVVRTRKTGEKIIVEIEDNGPGVPEELKEKLILPFFTTKKGADGTGLGLSISLEIIQAHNGTLNIESREGEFTRFTILLDRKDKKTGL